MINDYGLFYEETVNYLIRDAEYYGISKTQLDTYFIQNPATFLPDYIMDDSVQAIFT